MHEQQHAPISSTTDYHPGYRPQDRREERTTMITETTATGLPAINDAMAMEAAIHEAEQAAHRARLLAADLYAVNSYAHLAAAYAAVDRVTAEIAYAANTGERGWLALGGAECQARQAAMHVRTARQRMRHHLRERAALAREGRPCDQG